MKYLRILILILLFSSSQNISLSAEIYFIDLKKILNQSNAGKKAQEYLKNKLKDETKKFDKETALLKKEEADLISQKKIITPEEYKKKLNALRKKNISHQKSRQMVANDIFKKKEMARRQLNKALQPILEKYMSENNITMVLDRKTVVVAKTEIDLTDTVLKILNKELKSIKLN